MPNSNYRKGTRAERIVRAQLEALGYHVVRRYASKGPYDLLALPEGGALRGAAVMVEVKTGSGRMSPAERATLVDLAAGHGATPVHAHYEYGATTWHRLTGSGPTDWEVWVP